MNYNKYFKPMMKQDLLVCSCGCVEHQLIFSYFPDDKTIYVTTHLNTERNIFKRIISAVKYIFGYKSKYGHFDEIILDKEHAPALEKIVNYLNS